MNLTHATNKPYHVPSLSSQECNPLVPLPKKPEWVARPFLLSRVIRLGPHNNLTTLFGVDLVGEGQSHLHNNERRGGGRDDDLTVPSPPTLPNLIG